MTTPTKHASVTVDCIRCPRCGVDIYPPDDLSFKFVSKEKQREYTRKYGEKKKRAGDHHE